VRTIAIDAGFVAKAIPPRRKDSHKGMNGVVCVVGGSRLYHGAPFLAASGAMRAGVDLVYIAVPAVIAQAVRALSPDFIVIPLPDSKLTRGTISKLKGWLPRVDSIAVGPGLGPQSPGNLESAVRELKTLGKGLVLDADALRSSILEVAKGSGTVVTPHAGEFERLFSVRLPDTLDGRVELAAEKAGTHGVTVLLKGSTDVVTDGSQVGLNNMHSPSMTVGGTGDVLTGVTAAMIAKGVSPFEAGCCAAYITGAAGLEATTELGMHITASDVANSIARVMKRFDRVE
jgi:ADP-dependent NAD(P)H-hydrate dehydratase